MAQVKSQALLNLLPMQPSPILHPARLFIHNQLIQPVSNIKSIVNEAEGNVFRYKAIVEKDQASIVVFGLAENNNDKIDIKNMLDSVCNSIT